MSWLNNSLNTIKGQLTTLAQEVLAETAGPGDDDYRGLPVDTRTTIELLADTQKEKEDLDKLCSEKEAEIIMLRKQIEILQQQPITDAGGGSSNVGSASVNSGRNSKSPTDNNGSSPLEDSWCWEPDNTKTDNDHSSEASSGNSHEMVNIALDEVPTESAPTKFTKPRIQRLGGGNSQQNVDLQKRIQQLEEENKQLNISLEELDSQHSLAMQKMLELKTAIQEQLNTVTKDYEVMQKTYEEKFLSTANDIEHLNKNLKKLQKDKEKAEEERHHYEQQLTLIENELRKNQTELIDAQTLLSKKSQDNMELLELIKERDQQNAKMLTEHEELLRKLDGCTKELDELKLNKNKKSCESSTSSTGKQSEDEFIVVRDSDANSSGTGTPPTKEDLKDKIVQLENKLSELTLENGSLALKLENVITDNETVLEVLKEKALQLSLIDPEEKTTSNLKDIVAVTVIAEDELTVVKEKYQQLLAELQHLKKSSNQECSLLTHENERLQAELQSFRSSQTHFNELEQKLQAITVETQQLKLNTEAEAEASLNHHAELEEKLKSLSEENALLKAEIEKITTTTVAANEQKQTITDLDDEEEEIESDLLYNKLKDLMQTQNESTTEVDITSNSNKMYQSMKDKLSKMGDMEKTITRMSEKLLDFEDSKLVWDHEKKTLEADIAQYILQCDELMKNNEILLNELENYKRHKLETISEHNEENVVQLESQLEECNKLNASLNNKVEKMESDNSKLSEKLREIQYENEKLLKNEKDYNLQVETLELEKCNLLLELNGMKSELNEKTSATESVERCLELEKQLSTMTKDHSDLVVDMKNQKQAFDEVINEKTQDLIAKDIVIESLKEEIKCLKLYQEEAKKQIEQIKKELEEKIQKIQELNPEEFANLKAEKERIENKLNSVEQQLELSTNEIKLLKESKTHCETTDQAARIAELEAQLLELHDLQKAAEVMTHEKQDMIKVLQQKHSENMQYYQEIQRLQALVKEIQQINENKTCDKCTSLEVKVEDLRKQEEKLKDQITFLREKSDILTTNLLTEQTNQKLAREENADILEQNATLRKDLERLRVHLLEIEDMHTQETVEMQKELEHTKNRMLALEEEASKSNNAYTSASIRANQHAETLQAQYALVVQQRDDLVTKLSLAEDRESKNQAAITNLQCALEQFQNDKEHDIHLATQRIRRELQQQHDKETQLNNEIQQLQQQLSEANQGLRAASRLSDQLEASQQTVTVLREEVEAFKQQTRELESKLTNTEGSQADKIEKSLIKSLLIGYVVSGNPNDKQQILRMIASLLEFTQNETDKVGLNKSGSSWLGSLLGSGGNNSGYHSKENLVQAFVQFLEQESRPKMNESQMPNLLNITGTGSGSKNSVSRRTSNSSNPGIVPSAVPTSMSTPVPLLLNSTVIEDFPPTRNSSSILKDILNDT